MIRMLNAPTKGFGAFMPPPYAATTPAASSNGVIRVVGHPGTVRIPSPRPAAMQDGELGGPFNQPSGAPAAPGGIAVPNWFRPSIYWARISNVTTAIGFNRISSNIAPVPAPFIGRTGTQTQMKPRIGGRTATAWPRQFIRWPTYRQVKR